MQKTVLQILPELDCGGVERGTLQVGSALVKNGYRSLVVSGPGKMVSELVAEGSEHIELPVGKKSLLSLRLVPKLRKLLTEENIHVIHARSRLPAWLIYLAWKKMDPETRPAFVTTVHGPYTVNRYSQIMTSGQSIIAISEYIKNYIIDNYPTVDSNKIKIIHRGISKQDYPYGYQASNEWSDNWRKNFPDLETKYLITLPARITRWKGHNDFIEIITLCRKQGLNVHGLIAGGADRKKQRYLDELKSIIARHGMQDHFTFLGQRDDMKEIMSISDIVLSLANIPEAFGRTALEALSLGTPVIAYDHGGAAEVLADRFPIGRAKPKSTGSVVTLINEFYHNSPVVNNSDSFSLDQMLDKTLSVYESYF